MNADLQARLEPMARVIAQQLACKPEHFITHPSEKLLFRSLSAEDLRGFASAHGWRVVRRLGGLRIEFYNDANERQERARTGNTRPEDERQDR
jgi:hypothetical protein